ncbi:MAG TPA: hypothetical protein VFL57_22165, partial [Bryobacteraceae bacterium]|nr:hypothetical protein [Bryobacteraceae bacterium]
RNKKGETALTWAFRRGYTPIAETLTRAGADNSAAVKASAEKAIALLQKSGAEFFRVSGCTSCHNQSLPQMAWSIARERGLRLDEAIAQQQAKAVIAVFKPLPAAIAAGKANLPNPPISVSYSLLGLAAENYKPDATTDAMAELVSRQQRPDGSFAVLGARPPLEASTFTATALSLHALQRYGKNPAGRIERARQWLEAAQPLTTEDRVMQLLGLTWADSASDHRRAAAAGLLAEQRPDGAWPSCLILKPMPTLPVRRSQRCICRDNSRPPIPRIGAASPTCCAPSSMMVRGWCDRAAIRSSRTKRAASRMDATSGYRQPARAGP